MDAEKSQLSSYLKSSLVSFVFFVVLAIETIYLKSFSLVMMEAVLLILVLSSWFFQKKTVRFRAPICEWLIFALLVPFSEFYQAYADDWYYLIMNFIGGIAVCYALFSYCLFLQRVYVDLENETLAKESRYTAYGLMFVPILFLCAVVVLSLGMNQGYRGIMMMGYMTMVGWFSVVMMICAVFPAILTMRAILLIDKGISENDQTYSSP